MQNLPLRTWPNLTWTVGSSTELSLKSNCLICLSNLVHAARPLHEEAQKVETNARCRGLALGLVLSPALGLPLIEGEEKFSEIHTAGVEDLVAGAVVEAGEASTEVQAVEGPVPHRVAGRGLCEDALQATREAVKEGDVLVQEVTRAAHVPTPVRALARARGHFLIHPTPDIVVAAVAAGLGAGRGLDLLAEGERLEAVAGTTFVTAALVPQSRTEFLDSRTLAVAPVTEPFSPSHKLVICIFLHRLCKYIQKKKPIIK